MLSIVVGLLRKKRFGATNCRPIEAAFWTRLATHFLAGWTVHYWDASYVFLMFFMGSGIWMLDGGTRISSVCWPWCLPRAGSELRTHGGLIRGFSRILVSETEQEKWLRKGKSRPLDGMDALIAMTAEAVGTEWKLASQHRDPRSQRSGSRSSALERPTGSVEGGRPGIVAWNGCTDDTAEIARRHGATVVEIERHRRSPPSTLPRTLQSPSPDSTSTQMCLKAEDRQRLDPGLGRSETSCPRLRRNYSSRAFR